MAINFNSRILLVGMVSCGWLAFARGARTDEQSGQPPNPIVSKPGPASQADKSSFTLFNPTPTSLMRSFNTDRPDVTESPYTVDAGHFQAEFSFVEYTYDYSDGVRTDGFSVLPVNFRVGVLNDIELDLMLNPYQNVRVGGRSGSRRDAGFGDAEVRAKLNLWGNDGGPTAFGLLPFVRFPTGSAGLTDHRIEGGMILPLDFPELPGDFDLGTMAEFDVNRNQRNDGYGVAFVHTLTLHHPLFTEKASAYVEYVGVAPIQTGLTYLAYFDTGITYALSENVQIDTGINIGLSRHANDFTVFAGLAFRL